MHFPVVCSDNMKPKELLKKPTKNLLGKTSLKSPWSSNWESLVRSVRFSRIRGGFLSCFGLKSKTRAQLQWPVNSTEAALAENGIIGRDAARPTLEGSYCRKPYGDGLSVSIETEESPSHLLLSKNSESDEIFAREGWLYKKDHGLLSTWQRRFVTVQHGCLVYYENGKDFGGDQGRDIPILNCKVEEKEESNVVHGVHFSFAFVVHVSKEAKEALLGNAQRGQMVTYKGYPSYVFAANDARDRNCWVRHEFSFI